MYSFNLLVSYRFNEFPEAQNEVRLLLREMGDETPMVEKTEVKGIIGVKTKLESRKVITLLRSIFKESPQRIAHAVKWVPVDTWCSSDLDVMVQTVETIRDQINADETWAMDLEKRRYPDHHTYEVVTRLSTPFTQKVNLKTPDKYLRVDIIGEQAGISVLKPQEIFSIARG